MFGALVGKPGKYFLHAGDILHWNMKKFNFLLYKFC